MTKNKKQVQMRGVKTKDDIYSLFKIVDKLEQRISTLEKVIGKVQLRLGDVVLYIDKKAEQHQKVIIPNHEINADGTETEKDSIL